MTESPESDVSLKYFRDHKCRLPKNKITRRISCGKWRRLFLAACSVSISDARARDMFRSYASLGAEKYRHFKFYPYTIHPYSKLCLFYEGLLVFMLLWDTLSRLHVLAHMNRFINWDMCNGLAAITDVLYFILIIMNFFTGYVEGNNRKHVVLELRKASCHYLKTWFCVDVLSSSYRVYTFSIGFSFLNEHRIYIPVFLSILRLLRVPRIYYYMKHIFEAQNFQVKSRTVLESTFLIINFICQNYWIQYCMEFLIVNVNLHDVEPRNCSWLRGSHIWNETELKQLAYGLDRTVNILRRSVEWEMMSHDTCVEPYVIIAWFITQMIMFRCILLYLTILVASEWSKAYYYLLTQKVQSYMTRLRLPKELQKRILKFFSIKFHSHYYVESLILNDVTGQLREDIILHTRWQLVQGVEFLRRLPRELQIQVACKLKVEILAAGDIVYKSSHLPVGIYFIERGTVTIYSKSGRELCHYEDGDYFGVTSLFSEYPVQLNTAVAVTNCELFRLEKDDFNNTLGRYPEVYEEIKKVSMERTQWNAVLDEQFKNEMKTKKFN